MQKIKKLTAVLLSTIMILSVFAVVPLTVSAASYKEDFINALLENEDEWYVSVGNQSALKFTDLNFDGKLEFIMQYDYDAYAYYYFENDKINFFHGFNHTLSGYYDKYNEKYVMLGHSYCNGGNGDWWRGDFVLEFDGKSYYSNYYSSILHNYNLNTKVEEYQYYSGANGYADVKGLTEISEDEYNKINEEKLKNLVDINMKSEYILCSDWEKYSNSEKRQALERTYDSFKYDDYTSGLKIYSDHTNLNVKKGDLIRVGAGIFKNNQQITDITKLTFSVDDTSILSVSNTSVHDNCLFLTLKAKSIGTAYITFSDSNTGYVTRVSVTVYDNNVMAFTVSGVPSQKIEKYTTNFYNVNGLYIDSYTYEINSDKTTTVSFDVYNTNYIYGAVEVYNSEGSMTDAVILDKMTSNSDSIKTSVWDNTCCFVRDLKDGDIFTYRQESGFSKMTPVKVTIPENGYIKITTDTSSSFLVGLINGIDLLMGLKSAAGDIKGFDLNSKLFADKIKIKLIKEAVYAQLIKDEDKYAKMLFKNITKESTLFSSESLGRFSETFVNNLNQLNLEDLIFDTAVDFGWGVGESVFEYFSGPIGMVLKGMFVLGDLANLIIEENHYVASSGCGSICIQNQGGGIRASSQVIIKTDTHFNNDTALKVFEVHADNELLDIIKEIKPELYDRIQSGLSITYNISMIKDGKEVQPEDEVEVYIPISDNLKIYAYTGSLKIYRIEEDGTISEMDVKVKNGCLVFKTTHFSLYSIIASSDGNMIGDANGDGRLSVIDATLIQKYSASIEEITGDKLEVSDVNKDGAVNVMDATEIQKYLADLPSVLL